MKIAIVAPCHIPPTKDWIFSLQREAKLANADVIIVDDSDGKLGSWIPVEWHVYDYAKQKEFLGDLYEEFANIFHKSSAGRIFGHLVAYKQGYDVVIGLDSDCVVPFNFVALHVTALNTKRTYGWQNPLGSSGWYTRGYPYSMRDWKVVANMGLWDNVLDLNGKDRLPSEPRHLSATGANTSPAPIPFSGMNFALTRDAIPGFLFLPNFKYQDDEFRRIDDIWGGYIFQQLARKRKEGAVFGLPIVFHDTKVVAEEDAAEEAGMYKWEDRFIESADLAMLEVPNDPNMSYLGMYEVFASNFKAFATDAFAELFPAMDWWIKALKSL